jgi:hypothetical protein
VILPNSRLTFLLLLLLFFLTMSLNADLIKEFSFYKGRLKINYNCISFMEKDSFIKLTNLKGSKLNSDQHLKAIRSKAFERLINLERNLAIE